VDVGITAYFDCTGKTWKCKVTKADTDYNIGYDLLPGADEASIAAATAGNLCDMIRCLKTLGNQKPQNWYMLADVKAHEEVHVQEYKDYLNPLFATAKATIEGLSVPHTCGKTAGQAAADIKALAAYTSAINKMHTDVATVWKDPAYVDPNAATNAAEHTKVDQMIIDLRNHGQGQGWPACP
jgi:hypothetical protein